MKNRHSFQKHASLRSWLTGIIKHKVVDQMRSRAQETTLYAPGQGTDSLDDLFD